MAQRREGDERPALHVVDAGPVGDVALDAEGQGARERADVVHRVEMAQHEDAGLVAPPGRGHHQMVAEAVAPGDAAGRRAGLAGIGLHLVDHRG